MVVLVFRVHFPSVASGDLLLHSLFIVVVIVVVIVAVGVLQFSRLVAMVKAVSSYLWRRLSSKVAALSTRSASIEAHVMRLRSGLTSLADYSSGHFAALSNQLVEATARLALVEANAMGLRSAVTSLADFVVGVPNAVVEVARRLASVEWSVVRLWGLFSTVEREVAQVELEVAQVEREVAQVDDRVDLVDGRVDEIKDMMDTLGEELNVLRGQLETLEGSVGGQDSASVDILRDRVQTLEDQMRHFQGLFQGVRQSQERLKQDVGLVDERQGRATFDLDRVQNALTRRLDSIVARIQHLEAGTSGGGGGRGGGGGWGGGGGGDRGRTRKNRGQGQGAPSNCAPSK